MKKILVFLVMMTFMLGIVAANTVDSSTMVFEGTGLTETFSGSGVYTGTLDAIAGSYYTTVNVGGCDSGGHTPDGGGCVGGFDVYAKKGGTAYYDDIVQGTIGSDNDAYSSAGGWGAFWDPDVRDWENYQLTLEVDHWYLEYKGTALGTPMSGSMDWTKMYATETDTGLYRGTTPVDPDANDGDAALNGGGAQAWDMDWTWGSEAIPLEYPGFEVEIIDEGTYTVTLIPAPTNQIVEGEMSDWIYSISVMPSTLSFGTIPRGGAIIDPADNGPVLIDTTGSDTESGNVYVSVDVVETGTFYTELLELDDSDWKDAEGAELVIVEGEVGSYNVRLFGSTLNEGPGSKTATIYYTAYGSLI